VQLLDLVKPIEDMSDEELHEHLRQVRQRRTIERPASKTRAKKKAKKGNVTRINKAEDLFSSLSEEEKKVLLAQLQG